jgi:hypothetical protein
MNNSIWFACWQIVEALKKSTLKHRRIEGERFGVSRSFGQQLGAGPDSALSEE